MKLFPALFFFMILPLFAVENLEPQIRQLGPAPRLFASAADWQTLPERLKNDPIAADIYRSTKKRADVLLAGPLLQHTKEGKRRLTSARLFQGRIIDLATVARVESDPRYAARAKEELLATVALPDWGPQHFLDVAEYALSVAIGLDWLHDSLSVAEQDLLAKSLLERAIEPTLGPKAVPQPWLGGKSNWTQVCHAGLTAAALAIADREPAVAAEIIARAIREQAGPNGAYAPDGAYPEGPMYWSYGTTFEVILSSLLEHSFGNDFGLADYPGFLASADYLTQVTAPSGRYFNYADSREVVPPRPVLHWFAAKRQQPGIAASELLRLPEKTPAIGGELQAVYERHDALALWWHQPQSASRPAAPLPLNWIARGENPVAVFRSAWDDPRATYLAIKGGSPASSHAHMDAGSFILEAHGVRWAVDPGMQEYESLESHGIDLWDGKQNGERWKVFRLGSLAHNILRFNQSPQRVHGSASFTRFDAVKATAELNLTLLYEDHAKKVQRTFQLLPDTSLRLEDEWTARSNHTVLHWQWLTFATVLLTPDGALLRQNNQTLRLRVECSQKWTMHVEDTAQDLRTSDQPNPGLQRIVVQVKSQTEASNHLIVVAGPE